ncbi:MAG TPA: type II secretion system protein [Burkholderiaceae bacterium]
MPREVRTQKTFCARRLSGFSLLELMVAVMIISIAGIVLLNRLSYYQEMAEKADMEYTISALKSALRMRMASLMIDGRAQEIRSLALENPMDWLEKKPANYLTLQLPRDPRFTLEGNWYFDSANRVLAYQPKHNNYFQPDSSGQKRIRLQVTYLRNEAVPANDNHPNRPTDSVAVTLIEPYKWF